jgi:hypothetical protein
VNQRSSLKTKNCETTTGKNRENTQHISTNSNFLNRTPKAQHSRERIGRWNCIKLKCFFTANEIVTRLKRQPTEQEKIFPAIPLTRD